MIKTVGAGATASIPFAEITRTSTYQDNCRLQASRNAGGGLDKACDQRTGVGRGAIPPPIKLVEGDAAGLTPGVIITVAIDPKTRAGYLITARAQADQMDSSGTKLVKVRGMQM